MKEEREMEKILTVAITLTLEDFSNMEIAALNNAVVLYGHVPPQNIAYKKAVERHLIKNTGYFWDKEALISALSHVINSRIENGEWK